MEPRAFQSENPHGNEMNIVVSRTPGSSQIRRYGGLAKEYDLEVEVP